jgi:hypothetical protein
LAVRAKQVPEPSKPSDNANLPKPAALYPSVSGLTHPISKPSDRKLDPITQLRGEAPLEKGALSAVAGSKFSEGASSIIKEVPSLFREIPDNEKANSVSSSQLNRTVANGPPLPQVSKLLPVSKLETVNPIESNESLKPKNGEKGTSEVFSDSLSLSPEKSKESTPDIEVLEIGLDLSSNSSKHSPLFRPDANHKSARPPNEKITSAWIPNTQDTPTLNSRPSSTISEGRPAKGTSPSNSLSLPSNNPALYPLPPSEELESKTQSGLPKQGVTNSTNFVPQTLPEVQSVPILEKRNSQGPVDEDQDTSRSLSISDIAESLEGSLHESDSEINVATQPPIPPVRVPPMKQVIDQMLDDDDELNTTDYSMSSITTSYLMRPMANRGPAVHSSRGFRGLNSADMQRVIDSQDLYMDF